MINITLSNGNYELKHSISNTKAKVMIMVGGKEIGIMRKSANRLNEVIVGSELYILPDMGHGEISLLHPELYVELIRKLFNKSKVIRVLQ